MITRLEPELHEKGWGHEVWLVNSPLYCAKLLHFNKGAKFSSHYHLKKCETWYILEGELTLTHYDLTSADTLSWSLKPGDVIDVPSGEPHQLYAVEESTIIEVSTQHDEADSYRIGKGDSQK